MFKKIAKHRANDASLTMHRPPLTAIQNSFISFGKLSGYGELKPVINWSRGEQAGDI